MHRSVFEVCSALWHSVHWCFVLMMFIPRGYSWKFSLWSTHNGVFIHFLDGKTNVGDIHSFGNVVDRSNVDAFARHFENKESVREHITAITFVCRRCQKRSDDEHVRRFWHPPLGSHPSARATRLKAISRAFNPPTFESEGFDASSACVFILSARSLYLIISVRRINVSGWKIIRSFHFCNGRMHQDYNSKHLLIGELVSTYHFLLQEISRHSSLSQCNISTLHINFRIWISAHGFEMQHV